MRNYLIKWVVIILVLINLFSSLVQAAYAENPLNADFVQYKTLSVGSTGTEVAALKKRMFELGYFKSNTVNESYTSNTAEYIKKFEEMNGLPVDGIADPEMQALFFSDKARKADGTPVVAIEVTSKNEEIQVGPETEGDPVVTVENTSNLKKYCLDLKRKK